jgi:hypothetical protein
MKSLILHIGTHKTASSSLQLFLLRNKAELARHGFCYPTEGAYFWPGENSQSILSHAIRGVKPTYLGKTSISKKACIAEIQRDIERSPCQNVLISSEHLSLLDPAQIEELREVFAPQVAKVRVVVYLRRQDSRLESGYNQLTKTGQNALGFDAFVERIMANDEGNYDSDRLLRRFAAVFGRENIIVRPFERQQLNAKGIAHDFLDQMAVSNRNGFHFTEPRNESLPVEAVEILRLVYPHLESGELRKSFREFVISQSDGHERVRYTLFTDELRERVLDHYREGNRNVAKEYFGRDELFFDPANPALPRYRGLSQEKLAEISASIWATRQNKRTRLHKLVDVVKGKLTRPNWAGQ